MEAREKRTQLGLALTANERLNGEVDWRQYRVQVVG